MDYTLKELLDIPRLLDLLGSLDEVHSIPSAILDTEGNVLTAMAWQDICTNFHRMNPETEKMCIASDRNIEARLGVEPPHVVYRCPLGLVDSATPIIIDGKHLGNVFTGQLFLEPPDEAYFIRQARQYGFDEEGYLAAMRKVPMFSEEKIHKNLTFIAKLAQMLAEQGLQYKRQCEAEADLREAEWKFRALFDNGPIGVAYHRMIYDDSGKPVDYYFIDANDKFIELTGVDPRGQTVLQVFPGFENEEFDWIKTFGHVARTGEPTRFEQYFKVIERWCDCVGYQYKPDHFVAAYLDITERKQIEAALLESEFLLRESQAIAGLGSYVLDISSGMWKSSEVLDKVFGIDKAFERSIAGWESLIHPDDRTMMSDFFKNHVLANGQIFDKEYRIVRHNDQAGRWVRGLGKLEYDAQGHLIKMHGTIQDITERKLAEVYGDMGREILQILNEPGTLQESLQRVIAVLKTLTGLDAVGIRLQSGEDFPYYAQNGFSRDFLQTENTLIERDAHAGVCRSKDGNVSLECTCGLVLSGTSDPASTLFTTGGSFWTNDSFPLLDLPPGEDPRLHPRNHCMHEGYASMALIPIRNKDRIVGLIQLNDRLKGCFTPYTVELLEGIASHIGEAMMRKRTEEELQKKDAEIEQFIYTVSHDLRSPLVTVKTFMGYLEKNMAEGNQELLAQDIQFINSAADKMKLMLDELLELSRIDRVEAPSVRVSFQELLAEVVYILAGVISERKVEIHLPETDQILFGDRQRLHQVWQNLIENAIKYSRDGSIPRIELGVQLVNGQTVFFIKDNGIGIDPQYHSKIFGIFEKLDPKSHGAGLGLSMIQRIVEKYGGKIWVESEGIGKGSCFFFTLPSVVGHGWTS